MWIFKQFAIFSIDVVRIFELRIAFFYKSIKCHVHINMTDCRRFNLVRITLKLVRTTLCNCVHDVQKLECTILKMVRMTLKMMRTTLKFDFKIRALVFLTKFRQKSLRTCAWVSKSYARVFESSAQQLKSRSQQFKSRVHQFQSHVHQF